MDKQKIRRADLVFSIVLMCMSAWFFIKSMILFINPFGREMEMIHAEELKLGLIEWYKSPGLLPAVLSAVIFIMAVLLFIVARRDGAAFDFISKDTVRSFIKNRETRIAITVMGYLLLYIYGLIPVFRRYFNFFPGFHGFPFLLATFVYLSVFMITFNKKNLRAILTSLAIAALAASVITFGFGSLALIPLP